MRLLFVADGRSPIARSWIEPFIQAGDEVHLATTYRCRPLDGLSSLELVPVAFSGVKRTGAGSTGGAAGISWRTKLRHYLGPLTVPWAARKLSQLERQVRPDLVHALRVPFEGMVAASSSLVAPLVVSTWGNDFTLHADGSILMRRHTQSAMEAADGLHADCRRDLRLAYQWGFDDQRASVVLPGNGGLDPVFLAPEKPAVAASSEVAALLKGLAEDVPLIVNPRGFRAYVRNDTFFNSLPLVLQRRPNAIIVCPAMKGEALAEEWVEELGLETNVQLSGRLSQAEMALLLRRTQLVVSPSEHDGTPNSLLEAMASGAVPIAGDLESIREWIEHGQNGLLIDPADPVALAKAILQALEDESWRRRAQVRNRTLIEKKASRKVVFEQARKFYHQVRPARPML